MRIKRFNESIETELDPNNHYYWKVRKDEPYFTISMKKLNCSNSNIEYLMKQMNILGSNNDEFIILMKGPAFGEDADGIYNYQPNNQIFGTAKYNKKVIKYCEKNGMIYMGEIEVSDLDVEAYKYNL